MPDHPGLRVWHGFGGKKCEEIECDCCGCDGVRWGGKRKAASRLRGCLVSCPRSPPLRTNSCCSGQESTAGFPLPVGPSRRGGGTGGAGEHRGAGSSPEGAHGGLHPFPPHLRLKVQPPESLRGGRAPFPRSAPSRRAAGAVPRGSRAAAAKGRPRRTSGNVVRAAPLRKFFTLHVSLTAGLGFLGKGGDRREGGCRPGVGGKTTAAGRGPDPGSGRTVPPFGDGDRGDPPSRPEPSVSGPAPAVGGTRARLCREPRTSSLPAPPRRVSAPCGKGLGLPRTSPPPPLGPAGTARGSARPRNAS